MGKIRSAALVRERQARQEMLKLVHVAGVFVCHVGACYKREREKRERRGGGGGGGERSAAGGAKAGTVAWYMCDGHCTVHFREHVQGAYAEREKHKFDVTGLKYIDKDRVCRSIQPHAYFNHSVIECHTVFL